MKKLFIFFTLIFIFSKLHACEKIKPLFCGIAKCTYSAATQNKITTHRFVHTNQRPFYCSNCEYSGFKQFVTSHLRRECNNAVMKETILSLKTLDILGACTIPKKIETAFYLCGINGCCSKSRFIKKIAKHRHKKHITQKNYTCSLCSGQFDAKEGKRHVPLCAKAHNCSGQLIRNKLFPTVRALLATPAIGCSQDGTTLRLEDMPVEDASSIEYLPDSDEETAKMPLIVTFEQLLADFPEYSDGSLQGST